MLLDPGHGPRAWSMLCSAGGVLRLHRVHVLGRLRREGGAGRICRQDNPVTRHPVHTVECALPEKVVAPKKCHSVDGPKTAGLSKKVKCKHLTAW